MIRKKRLVVVFIVVFGLLGVANLYAQNDVRLNGTWVRTEGRTEFELMFQNGNFEESMINIRDGFQNFFRGTYTANNGNLNKRQTHIMFVGTGAAELGLDSGKWYTINEYKNAVRNLLIRQGAPQDIINELMADDFSYRLSYSVVSSSLILTYTLEGENNTIVFNKK